MTEPDDSFIWVSVKQFATMRGVHVQTVYSAIREKQLPAGYRVERIGRTIRIGVPRGSIQERMASS